MEEITCNLHIHSIYSDGSGNYGEIAKAALEANRDVIIITDHNIHVSGLEGYHRNKRKQVLVLTGEEVHYQAREPQKNHMLIFGAESEVATFASDPQKLINEVSKHHGLSFLAHPDEMDLPIIHEDDISWVDWQIAGFTGFELWNQFSELKTASRSVFQLLRNIFFPRRMTERPNQKTLDRWDAFLTSGKRLSVVGGVDAHAIHYHLGPFIKVIFPYQFHFSSIVNHLLLPESLNGDLNHDKALIYSALAQGNLFIAYELPESTKGFSFSISDQDHKAEIGQCITMSQEIKIEVHTSRPAHIRIVRNGKIFYESLTASNLEIPATSPGVYRVECYLRYKNKQRGWIFTNPIYVK